MGTYQAVIKSSISAENHIIYFKIDVVVVDSIDAYFIGFVCMTIYGAIVTVSALLIIWILRTNLNSLKRKSKWSEFACLVELIICLSELAFFVHICNSNNTLLDIYSVI